MRGAADGVRRTAEIKRMWISPALRGKGAGRALLTSLEDHARRMGCARAAGHCGRLAEAQALYTKAGYVEIPACNDNPHAAHWFEKTLR